MKKTTRIICHMLVLCMLFGLLGGVASYGSASAAVKAKSVKLNKKKISLTVGKTYTLKAKVKPAKAKTKLTWKSSRKSVATVSKKGKVTAMSEGSAKITVQDKKSKLKATCKVTVTADSVTPGGNGTQAGTNQGTQTGTQQGSTPADPNGGNVTPVATPEPTPIHFDNPATAVKLTDNDYVTIQVGDTYKLNSQVTPSDADEGCVKFSSLRDWVASVDDDGTVTGEYPGMTIITLKSLVDDSVSASIHVNVVDTSQPPNGFDSYDSKIEHGKVVDLTYPTEYRNSSTQHALMWLPPNYDESDRKYNILFCLHGGQDNEYNWTQAEAGDKVLDCLYSQGLMEETIVVFTSGVISYNDGRNYPNVPADRKPTGWGRDHFLLEFEIVYDLLPYMIENYPVMEGPEHTAVCGLSMGGGQTLDIGLNNLDVFHYVGCFSAGPFASGDQTFVRSKADAEAINEKVKFLTIMVGTEDHMGDDNVRVFSNTCKKYEVNYLFVEEQGLNHEPRCWNRNLYKFMKYAFK